MKFSVIVPIYNMEEYLPEMLESAAAQDFTDFNLVLVDDGSTDGCPAICDAWRAGHPGTVVVHKKNGGLISARRAGISEAKGRYIMFCDADDMLKPDALSELDRVTEESDADMVIFNADIYDGTRKPFFRHILPEGPVADKNEIYDRLFLDYCLNSMCLKAVKRSCFDAERDYSPFYGCSVAEDMLQSVPLLMAARSVYYLDKELYDYRMDSGMTHKCNYNYYWSNKMINEDVRARLKDEGVEDLEIKASYHILIAAYAGVTQMKWADMWEEDEIKKIAADFTFLRSWDTVWNTVYARGFNIKQRLILKLLKDGNYKAIRWLLRVRGGK